MIIFSTSYLIYNLFPYTVIKMKKVSLLTLAALFGYARPEPEVSIFADHLLDMVNKDDGMDFYKYIKPTNYTTEFNDLNERYSNGNIAGSDAFKSMT